MHTPMALCTPHPCPCPCPCGPPKKYAALKKQKADELRDLRLKMVNEGARIKRVEEERAVRAIAKFANEDKIKLTQKDIKAAANQLKRKDNIPTAESGSSSSMK